MQITGATAGKWRRRFIERRINGLYDELRPGKPRSIDDERVADLINKTLHTKPADGATHWSVRSIVAETAISPASVHRYFKLLGFQPHRSETFKLSTDAFFIEKLRDVVRLYLNPPENALVLCVDEKSQCHRRCRRVALAVGCRSARSSRRAAALAIRGCSTRSVTMGRSWAMRSGKA